MISLQRKRFAGQYGKTPEETSACTAYVEKWWQKEAEHRLRIADEVAEGIFLFDLPWDMEQTAEPVAFAGDIDWMHQPGDDPEFIYQLNRHRYWVCLGQAYAMTGDERYAETFARQLVHWVRNNPITEETKPKTWRTIEAGLRGESWIKAMGYFASSPSVSDEVFAVFLEGMVLHGAYLAVCDVPFSTKSNWGVLENCGLYEIGVMLACVEDGERSEAEAVRLMADVCAGTEKTYASLGKEYARLAKERLTRQISVQVMDDGVHWEQSPMYHNEVLKCYLEALRTAKLCGDVFPSSVTEKVKAMAYADRMWQKPDGSQPSGGDSDVTDLRDVLTVCGYWFSDPELKSGGFERMDYEGVWDYGMAAAAAYEALDSRQPSATHAWLKDSGNWYLRSSWEKDADYLHVCCGGLGGGHGHFDKCHLDLVVGGEDILVDPGRFTYVDGKDRRAFKGAMAHNSVAVDGAEYTHCLDSWGVEGLLPAVPGAMCRKEDYTLIECGHLGYLDRGVYVQRRILAIGTGIYLVMDTCYGSGDGAHRLEQRFHLAPGVEVEMADGTADITVHGKHCRVGFRCVSEGVSVTDETCFVSGHYNRKEPGRAVTFARTGSGTFGMITVIACGESGFTAENVPVTAPVTGRILEGREAEAVKVTCGGRTWLAVNAHVEAGADCEYIGSEGYYGLGRVMAAEVMEATAGTEATVNSEVNPAPKEMTVLQW